MVGKFALEFGVEFQSLPPESCLQFLYACIVRATGITELAKLEGELIISLPADPLKLLRRHSLGYFLVAAKFVSNFEFEFRSLSLGTLNPQER